MKIVRSIGELLPIIKAVKLENKSIGFVPTMGFLHRGHRSLVEAARNENDFVVVSIFVNPIQFGPKEDLDKYPRNESGDCELLQQAGCDLVFIPSPGEMYIEGHNTYVEVLGLTEGLCGASRPGHFKGVCTVVLKLFNLVKPTRAYFGQKDAQQLSVIKRMVLDLNLEVRIVGCPIIRETDGLALSSRNTYLSEQERAEALVLSQALKAAGEMIEKGEYEVEAIKSEMTRIIDGASATEIDYIEFVDNLTLNVITRMQGEVLIALAVKVGKTRLIDNMVVNI